MHDKQKKVILITLTILAISIAVSLSLAILIMQIEDWKGTKQNIEDLLQWFFSNFGTLTLGLILKTLVNKRHIKEIKREVKLIEDLRPKEEIEEDIIKPYSY